MIRFFVLFFALAVASCASQNEIAPLPEFGQDKEITENFRSQMLGDWCGEMTLEDGSVQKWTVLRLENGSYRIDFDKTDLAGTTESWTEYGLWGVRAPIYFTATRGFIDEDETKPADTSDPAYYDAYKILSLNEHEFSYQSYTSGRVFSISRECSEKHSQAAK